ncbi:hypothetical protein VP01_1266g8 [Puccinia sorghi]|uniref:Uncharacterized protein n=1 Tax=Puccinia sorghi TaxID=27349 RepID=A0A0L6VP23_9BASI|nr:hypothetical protein VP01_1266g8 [Puccinia sorghi]
MDDFSCDLEKTPLLYELDKWINDAFQGQKSSKDPPTTRQSEEPFTNTTGHSAAPSVSPATADAQDDATTTQDEGEIKVSLEYIFFIEEKKKQSTNTRPPAKRKGAPDGEIKYNGFKSDRGKMSILWKNTNLSLSAFKMAAINVIAKQDAKEPTHAPAGLPLSQPNVPESSPSVPPHGGFLNPMTGHSTPFNPYAMGMTYMPHLGFGAGMPFGYPPMPNMPGFQLSPLPQCHPPQLPWTIILSLMINSSFAILIYIAEESQLPWPSSV